MSRTPSFGEFSPEEHEHVVCNDPRVQDAIRRIALREESPEIFWDDRDAFEWEDTQEAPDESEVYDQEDKTPGQEYTRSRRLALAFGTVSLAGFGAFAYTVAEVDLPRQYEYLINFFETSAAIGGLTLSTGYGLRAKKIYDANVFNFGNKANN